MLYLITYTPPPSVWGVNAPCQEEYVAPDSYTVDQARRAFEVANRGAIVWGCSAVASGGPGAAGPTPEPPVQTRTYRITFYPSGFGSSERQELIAVPLTASPHQDYKVAQQLWRLSHPDSFLVGQSLVAEMRGALA